MSKAINPTATDSVQSVLTGGAKRKGKGVKWLLSLLVFGLVAGGAGYYFLGQSGSSTAASYNTAPVKTGNLSVTVTATGNLKPVNQVDIGTELSSTVSEVLVDANDTVKKGQVLAKLNTSQLQDTITKNRASLASSQAKVKQAAASLKTARTNLARLQQLYQASGGKLPTKSDMDSAVNAVDQALGDQDVAKTSVVSAEADLRSAQTNLGKAIITAPFDGVVLIRSVEPGQTVAASLSAPTLFTMAEDLSKMQAEVSVDEADVGKLQAGQKAEFTVDAWPGRKYQAEVTRVSLGATTTNNVVSYLTELAVQNPDLSLRSGMTATATIETDSRENVLLVPNAALRFKPKSGTRNGGGDQGASASSGGSSFLSQLMPRPPRGNFQKHVTNTANPAQNGESMQKVWVLQDGKPAPVKVKTGLTDGKMTEIVSGDLKEGADVITEAVSGSTGGQP
jgi:HlyD family secretion protein